MSKQGRLRTEVFGLNFLFMMAGQCVLCKPSVTGFVYLPFIFAGES